MSSENTVTNIFKNQKKRMVDIVNTSNKDLKGKSRLKNEKKKMRESVQELQPHKTLSSSKNKPRKSMELSFQIIKQKFPEMMDRCYLVRA